MKQDLASLLKALAVASALMVAGVGGAVAGPSSGSLSITSFGSQTTSPDDALGTDTTLNLAGPFFAHGAGSGGLSGISGGTSITFSNTTFSIYSDFGAHAISPFTVNMTSGGDTYTFSLSQEKTISRNITNSGQSDEQAQLNIGFIGTLADSLQHINSTASLQIALTQSGGPGSTISFAGTAAYPNAIVPNNNVPEPASLLAMAAGLVGLAFSRAKRG
jgi:hypothetical protein